MLQDIRGLDSAKAMIKLEILKSFAGAIIPDFLCQKKKKKREREREREREIHFYQHKHRPVASLCNGVS